ncbi:MAG: lamin tail domain-containing protein [Leadbetterella sp.]
MAYLFSQNIKAQSIQITEIMADPTPSKGLPEREYVEIYNVGTDSVLAKKWTLKYNTSSVSIPDFTIKPKEYIILCRRDYALEFAPYGKTLGLVNFSLLNEGTTLEILNESKESVSKVTFNKSWYTKEKSEGYSLELIAPSISCKGKEAWRSSIDKLAGTPGKVNSQTVFIQDTNPPKLSEFILEGTKLRLAFDENVEVTKNSTLDFIILGNESLKIVGIQNPSDDSRSIDIVFNQTLDPNTKTSLSFTAKDCLGNVSTKYSIILEPSLPVKKGDIILNEVLFADNENSVEFFELFNTSNETKNIRNLQINLKNGDKTAFKTITPNFLVIPKLEYIVIVKNEEEFRQKVPIKYKSVRALEMPTLPTFNNEGGELRLYNADSSEIDAFRFGNELHSNKLKETSGVSLERSSPNSVATISSNLHSASADVEYQTPGSKNSNQEIVGSKNKFWLSSKVVSLRSNSQEMAELKYELAENGVFATIKIMNRQGQTVQIICNSKLLGTEGSLFWDGNTKNGSPSPTGYYYYQIELILKSKVEKLLVPIVISSY